MKRLASSCYQPLAGFPITRSPADEAGKHASLYFYLDRPVLAFRPERDLPAVDGYCLFTSQGLDELEKTAGFTFREIARAEHDWWSYRLGICAAEG